MNIYSAVCIVRANSTINLTKNLWKKVFFELIFGAKIQTRNCRFLKCEFRFREVENGRIFKIFVDDALVKIMRKFMCE